jgi:hypothetical protein
MLRWFMYIVGGGQGLSKEGLTELGTLAASMGARREWDALHKTITS